MKPADMLDCLAGIGHGAAPELPSVFDGRTFLSAASGDTIATVDPSTERTLAKVARGGTPDIRAVASASRRALQGPWRSLSPQDRGALLVRLGDLLDRNIDLLARLETLDVGKPLSLSRGDVAGAVATLTYNAGAADKLEGVSVPLGPQFVDYTELEPLGVTGHIMPWNYPLGMAMRSVAPALAAGCPVVLKPAEQTPLTTLALAALCAEAGFPEGVVTVATGYGQEAGAALTEDPDIDGVTFTGSVATGRQVAVAAGKSLKPAVLELGGKNPLIVFEDADIDTAVETALDGAFDNAGQVCSSSSRLILHRDVRPAFLERLVERARTINVAPGMDDADMGPLVSAEQYEKVSDHIDAARRDGATLLLGGGRPANVGSEGYFVAPTVFDNVDPASRIAREETFGPVATVFEFQQEQEAVDLANSLPFGLVAGLHTSGLDRSLRLARRLEAGSVWVNGWFIGGVQAPTGGIKDSGIGRERGLAGIQNYVRIKNIGIRLGGT